MSPCKHNLMIETCTTCRHEPDECCEFCGTPLLPKQKDFCSSECSHEWAILQDRLTLERLGIDD